MSTQRLPKLLYIGDVPVEPTVAGAALLYRLLQSYPAGQLMVMQSEHPGGNPVRLPGVRYELYRPPRPRLPRTRLYRWDGALRYLAAPRRVNSVRRLAADFGPGAILTVVAGYSWITAAAFAQQQNLPLHLIIHDDVPATLALPASMRNSLSRKFAAVYRQAANRFCISPQMAEAYSLPGAPARVLYPSRSAELIAWSVPAQRPAERQAALIFGYAGSINSPGYSILLERLARVLQPIGGKLALFSGPNPPVTLLKLANVESHGFVPNSDLPRALRDSVDVLFLPMSFAAADRQNMTLSFPSKLADYTAACLPVLICGPAYCSAARWAREHPGVAELVESQQPDALAAAVTRLADRSHRDALAVRASQIGDAMFSHRIITKQFLEAIASG